jgi:ATP-dependent helicase/DNAse subunit B
MSKIYIFPFRTLKEQNPSKEVLNDIFKNLSKEKIYYIAPTQRKINEIKEIFKGENIYFYNIESLTDEFYKKYCSKKVIDKKNKLLLILDILTSNEKIKKIYGNTPGVVTLISEFIDDLKFYLYQKDLPSLREKIDKLLMGYDKVKEQSYLALEIFETYETLLREKNIIDEIDKKLEVADIIEKNKITFNVCIFDGFYDLPKIEEVLFEKIINNSKNVFAIIYQDERILEIKNIQNDFLKFLNKFDFFEIVTKKPSYDIRVKTGKDVIKAMSIEDEVVSIARGIKYLCEKEKVKEKEIIVTFPSMYTYIPYIERIFKKYNINYTTSVEKPLSSFPQIVPVVTLLECILENYPRRKMIDIVTSSCFNRFSKNVKDLISIVSRKAGIVCGKEEWFEMDIRIKNDDKEFYERYQRDIELIKKELDDFFKLFKVDAKVSFADFITFLKNILDYLKYEVKSEEIKGEFNNILNSFIIYSETFGKKYHDFSTVCLILRNILTKTNFKEECFSDGVRVIGILDTRGLYSKYIFFGGLCDGEYPLKPKQEMILPDRIRKELGLMYFERRINMQKLHFYRLIESSENDTFLSYPMQEKDRIILPSNFLPEIVDNVKYRHFDIKDTYFNEEEKQRHNGEVSKKEFSGFEEIKFIKPDKVKKIINKYYGEEEYISVTKLDKYIKCPFVFYIEEILKISPLEEPTYELDSATFGKVIHSIMKEVFKVGKKDISNIEKDVYYSLEKILKKERLKPFWKDFIKNKINFIIGSIMKEETSLMNVFPEILYTEKSIKAEIIPSKLRLKGKIDRVDIDKNGNNFLVIDYKTGSRVSNFITDTNKLRSLQLALYAKMVLLENPQLKLGGLGVYNLREGKVKFVREKVLNNLVEDAVKKAEEVIDNIRNANFPKDEGKSNCKGCSYSGICG